MKKLNLKLQSLTNPNVLTRQQLKNVMGGDTPITTGSGNYCCIIFNSGQLHCQSVTPPSGYTAYQFIKEGCEFGQDCWIYWCF